MKWLRTILHVGLISLCLVSCAKQADVQQSVTPMPTPCTGSNALVDRWPCPNRKVLLALILSDKSDGFRVLSERNGYPYEVKEPKHHLEGYVDYDSARITEVHGDKAGHFTMLLISHGQRFMLRWRFDGEFDRYEGVQATK